MNISILGSTGSIGRQTLEALENLGYSATALAAHSSVDLLEAQIRQFRPNLAVAFDEAAALELKRRIGGICEVATGMDGLKQAASLPEADIVVNALMGNVGFLPTIAALEAGKRLALANKEVLVCGGEIIMPLAKSRGVEIIPIDSEHSAIFQCLQSSRHSRESGNPPTKIHITASGGPFRGRTLAEMGEITPEQALKHPNWSMGAKISVDSATLMNKGLEVIEAYHLFGLKPSQIEVLVHPQSIIHSMVEFADGQILAQLGAPDMRPAIQYALTHPARVSNPFNRLNFAIHNTLTFEPPDFKNFPCLGLAYEALAKGGLYPTVLNSANEAAVARFLDRQIKFLDIARIIESALSAYNQEDELNIENILKVEAWAKAYAERG
ncbi:MAG: 1-deoxy-D-xylulose-5-phosphate reductoisomerase [Clostridiales bacterium]|jgi:1-deoxy-D-xylulose-5-phosphate reductoisomerase|nr:1-deoxy-D-xylulose-5-phosphate reductoisomerase [Clostridiales bacterium]